MSKYERCREDVVAHFEFAVARPEDQPCPACRGTGEGKNVILGLGRTRKEKLCRVCCGTGCAEDVPKEESPYSMARESIERHKNE